MEKIKILFVSNANIFIYTSYTHNIFDTLIANFYCSKSTLIILVTSFLGYKNTINAYDIAILNKYNFFIISLIEKKLFLKFFINIAVLEMVCLILIKKKK